MYIEDNEDRTDSISKQLNDKYRNLVRINTNNFNIENSSGSHALANQQHKGDTLNSKTIAYEPDALKNIAC